MMRGTRHQKNKGVFGSLTIASNRAPPLVSVIVQRLATENDDVCNEQERSIMTCVRIYKTRYV